MPFLYRQPARFRIGRLEPRRSSTSVPRYTIDTRADLAFARAVAQRLGHGPPVALAELDAIIRREPDLAEINAGIVQRSWSLHSQ